MKSARILIVEDNAIVVMELKCRLANMGHEVVAYADRGDKAIGEALRLKPDLILMDIQLKGEMDGIDAAETIRDKIDTVIVFLTAYSDPQTLNRAKIVEPYGYILKPFEERDLHITLEMALYKHEMERERVRLQAELKEARNEIKTLQTLLPICGYCKKIRNDQGYWKQLEDYLSQHYQIELSHSICPSCLQKQFPEISESLQKKKKLG